ncbi:MAG TPA: XdhC family protein, partial [Allocoleopsis sp.]
MNELQRILQVFEQSQQTGKRAVLATVVRTRGSVYRRPGARMLITEDGQMVGAISGGCLEADILERSRSLFSTDSNPILVRYDTTSSDDIVFGLGLGCSGVVEVLIEPLNNGVSQLNFIQHCLNTQQIGVIATVFSIKNVPDIKVGDRLMMRFDAPIVHQITNSDVADTIAIELHKTLIEQQTYVQSCTISGGQIDVLLEVIRLPVPLLIFGSGHDVIPVVQFAKQLGWHVTVIDHRPEQLTHDRFPLADQLYCYDPNQPNTYRHLLT